MRKSIMLFCLTFYLPLVLAAPGLISEPSGQSVQVTMDRLQQLVTDKGFRVFARIDHAAGAAGVGMTLRPTQLLIFGNPKGGTVLMQNAQSVGIDLPLRYLVWQDAQGEVWISWNDSAQLTERHQLPADLPVLNKMNNGLAGMAKAAAAP